MKGLNDEHVQETHWSACTQVYMSKYTSAEAVTWTNSPEWKSTKYFLNVLVYLKKRKLKLHGICVIHGMRKKQCTYSYHWRSECASYLTIHCLPEFPKRSVVEKSVNGETPKVEVSDKKALKNTQDPGVGLSANESRWTPPKALTKEHLKTE